MFLSSVYQVCICLRSSSMAFRQRFLELMLIPLVSAAAKILERCLTLAARKNENRPNTEYSFEVDANNWRNLSSLFFFLPWRWFESECFRSCFALNENEGRWKMNENREGKDAIEEVSNLITKLPRNDRLPHSRSIDDWMAPNAFRSLHCTYTPNH